MYAAARWIARTLIRQYYSFHVHGGEVPDGGPLVVVGNHQNGLIDPAALFHATGRELRFLAKFKLFRVPLLGHLIRAARAIPVYRKKDNVDTALNKQSFEAVHAALLAGNAVVLFPEGESGPERTLRRLKTGAARMALDAEAGRGFEAGLHIVPIGIFYEDRDRYRSRVHVWVGEAFTICHLRSAFAADEWTAAERLTTEIRAGLERVTVAHAQLSDRAVLELAATIGPLAGAPPERQRHLALGLDWLREHRPERARDVLARADALRRRLTESGLDAHEIDGDVRLGSSISRALRGLLVLLVGFPLVLAGALGWVLPVAAARLAARFGPSPPDKFVTVTILGTALLGLVWVPLVPFVLWKLAGATPALGALVVLIGALWWMPRMWEQRSALFADLRSLLFFAPRRRTHDALLTARDAFARELALLDRLRQRAGVSAG